MRNFFLGLFLGLVLTAWAGQISAPPPLPESSLALQHYLHELYRNNNNLEVTTVNPDGVRAGRLGDILLLQTGGSNYIEMNTNGSKQWRGILLSDTP